MCILLALARDSGAGELCIAANRDERLDRPWQPPRPLLPNPPVFGGRDLVGGGSWLAVNLEAGFVVAVTNARQGAAPRERSRGTLVLDLACERSLAHAVALASELELARYGEFNLLLADARTRWLATNEPAPLIERAEAPLISVGNSRLLEPGERVLAAADRAGELADLAGEALLASLRDLLADHRGADPLCRHGERYGTVCSSLIVLRGRQVLDYRFAPGPPCTTPFAPVALPAD
ncbi:MAG: NRDE family protein [Thermoanaerobaculaceae bacterium]